ncbi:DUF6851 domain-containing protein [Shimia sp. R9_3]|uniref:DUF6851 domain-containing protein n=1 Tax=Shimia sp. R9_3 TaxID=2821113 RepID=UPI001ADD1962|nr:Ig-like domain-containing protein [Shimia sp. R9_3]MBO9403261.1 Ig-like domain-containing protein [Shimia sp. R9_3]
MFDESRSVAARWNELALEAIRLGDPVPTEMTRALHIAHSAMYDAWAAFDADAAGAYFTNTALGPDSLTARETAVSHAAFTALSEVFPDQTYLFLGLMADLGLDETDTSTDLATAVGVGNAAAVAVIVARENDGSNSENDFEDTADYEPANSDDPDDPNFDPNSWTPLRVPNGTVRDEFGNPIATDNPASYTVQKPISPHWGDVTPFAISDSDLFLPPAPPKLGDVGEYIDAEGKVTTGDAAYREQFGELVDISANLTPEQKAIAEYWADGPQTSTPPGHWNEIAQDISVRDGHGLAEDVKMFFALNNALFDTGIAVWGAKYTYDYVRPQTAVRHLFDGEQIESWAGPNQGTQLIDGAKWIPYQDRTFVTPAFPEYTSGHSGFSYAGATVLSAFAGTDAYFDGSSEGAYDLDGDGALDLLGQYTTNELSFEEYDGSPITLQWDTLFDAAAEAGLSRLYGGIHIQDGDLFGREIGAEVGEEVWEKSALLFERDADNIFDTSAMSVSALALGAGSDRILGSLVDLNGLEISDFGFDDQIEIAGFSTHDGDFSVSRGSAIIDLDQDGDGASDATIVLSGDFSEDRFVAVEVDGVTSLRIANDSDVELTDESERLFTEDEEANVIAAGDGDDVVISAGGGDILDGDAGSDELIGGEGDDVLIGGKGNDITTGGAGADIFAFDASDAPEGGGFNAEFIKDFETGVDKVEISGYDSLSFDTLVWTTTPSGIALVLPNSRFITFEGISSESELAESDFSFPTEGRNVAFAQSAPQILTDDDDSYISDGDFADRVQGRDGDDVIVTADGDDLLLGGDASDVLIGGSGSDTLVGGQGNDDLTGGAGEDTFRFEGADDPTNSGFVADFVKDYQSGIDTIEIRNVPGILQFSDLSFVNLPSGLGANLGGSRFIVFEGLSNQSELDPNDFVFIDDTAPDLTIALATDSGNDNGDGLTNDPTVVGTAIDNVYLASLELSFDGVSFQDITDQLAEDGSFQLDEALLATLNGESLEDGTLNLTVRATDGAGQSTDRTLAIALDRQGPEVAEVPSGTLSVSPDTLTITYSEAMANDAFDIAGYSLTDALGAPIDLTSLDVISDNSVRLNIADTLSDGDFTLSVPSGTDLAGNAFAGTQTFDFTVDAITRIVRTGPSDGTERSNLDRQIFVEFDRPIDPATVTSDSFQVMALGEALDGRITVSSNGRIITFFPDDLLPAATELRIKVDGDTITGLDGKPVDADGDGAAGGLFQADFQTVTLTRVPGTNVEGFIFDANYRDEDDMDIPLEGVVVSVIGLPGVTAVTDENGRFLIENLPIPQVYLSFDASNVTNRPEFDYGTIDKPVDTVAGRTVGLQSGEKAFNIYFAALAEGDVTEIVEGQETEAGIGENGLQNLTEIFPNIDPAEWDKLKVTIPADSLTFDDGTLAEEVSVMVFEPDRIPAPLPPGFDPTVVFTVKAGDATNVDGKAQIDFPNLDGLAIGEKRPILSFDHDAGKWVQSGTAIVVDDGNGGTVLRSEGDTGVNTLGWKGIGGDPTEDEDTNPNPEDGPEDSDGDGIPDPVDPDDDNDGQPDEEDCDGDGDGEADPSYQLNWQYGWSYQIIPVELSAGFNASLQVPEDIFPEEFDIDPADLNFDYGQSYVFEPFEPVTGSGGDSGSFEISEWLADILYWLPKSIEVRVTGSVSISMGVGLSAELDIEPGEGDIELEGIELRPGNIQADVTASIELDGTIGRYLDFLNSSFEATIPIAGLPTVDLGEFRLGSLPVLPIRDFEFALDLSANAAATTSASGEGSGSFSISEEPADHSECQNTQQNQNLQLASSTSEFALNAASQDFQSLLQSTVAEALTIDPDALAALENLPRSNVASVANVDDIYYLYELENGLEVRGSVKEGQAISALLPADEAFTLYAYSPRYNSTAIVDVAADEDLPDELNFPIVGGVDLDGDLIPDLGEYVIGTSDETADSDGDGISDSAELEQGLNPLDGVGFPTGLIGNVKTTGDALDVALTGALDGSGGQTAFVATGNHGLAIVDASQFSTPILQSELDLSGNNTRVEVDPQRGLAFLASTAGLHIVDVSDPLEPTRVNTVDVPDGAQSLMYRDGLLFVGGRDLYVGNTVSSELLTEIDTRGPVKDIAASGDTIYAIVDNRELVSFAFNGQSLIELDSVTIPTPPRRVQPFEDFRLFISDDTAYVSNGFDLTLIAPTRPLERGGYVTFDVSDPGSLELISNIDTPAVQAANLQTVTNGAGLGLVAAGQRGLQIHDTSDPQNTYDLIAEFDTPGDAQAVELASGIAYVADGSGGLQVINFLPFDANGEAPTVTINSDASDADPSTDGIQVEEGKTIRLDLGITDDVQVRNVELLVNGQVVLNDVSAPYELAFAVPALSNGATNVDIAVRATDTGGNSTTSETITFEIIPDITPPEVLSISPYDGRLVLVGESTVSISFSEPLDPNTISEASVVVVSSDNTVISARDLVLLADGQVALFTFDPLALGDYTLSFDLSEVSDRAGNLVVSSPVSQSITVVDATAIWNDPAGGNWFDPTKWESGTIPTSEDGVAIVLDDDAIVAINGSSVDVDRLLLQGNIQLSGGVFRTDDFEGNKGSFIQTGGVVADTDLKGTSEFNVELSGGLWSGVDLSVDAHVQSSRRLDVRDGLTVDGRLGVEASGRVYFQGVQSIDGSGLIELETPSSWLYHVNQLSGSQEIVTFGPDLTLQGQGYITVSSGEDAFRLLGDVRAVGGDLQLNYIDNDGATLSLDSAGGGFVSLRASIENAAIEVSDGADVRAVSSQLSGVSLGGAGVTRIESATVSDLTVLGQAEIEGVTSSFSSPSLSVTNDLTIDGELALSGTNQRTATLRIDGAQTVDGSGTVLLSRNNAISDEVVNNTIRFNGQLFGEREDLIFGPDLTIRGTGNFSVDNGEDRLQMLGTVAAEGGDLLLRYVDNMGEVLTVDPGDGALKFGTLIENTVVTAASGATGSVGFESGVDIRSTTFNADARLEATFGTQVDFEGDVTINGTFELAASPSREATINLRGAQTIDGTGEILMSRANLNPGQAGTNNVTFVGDLNGTEEIGTFGAGLGLRGTGILSASRGEDSIRVLGQVTAEDGDLILRDVDNAGADLIVDATAGQVVLGERVTDTVATGTGTLGLEDGLRMDGLTLNMDALIGGQTQGVWVYSEGTGLTVNATLEIAAGVSRNAYLELEGEQTLGGTGTIRLTDANNPLQDPNNLIIFDGQDNNAVETLTIAEEMEVIGEGYIYAQDQNDTILLEGTILADDGTLRIDDLEGLEGTLGATDDGVLNIQTPLTLTERGTLAVGVSNDGVGLINATGNVFSTAVELMGTLAIDVEDGFTANIGDQFAFMTSNSGFSGDFDGFAGFDLAGNQAFKLIQTSTTQLALEVTTDQDANNLGFFDSFTPGPRPPFVRTDLALDDAIGTFLSDVNIIADRTIGGDFADFSYQNAEIQTDLSATRTVADASYTLVGGLLLEDAVLSMTGTSLADFVINVNGTQTIGGNGIFDFDKVDLGTGTGALNLMRFNNRSSEREVLTIEEGVTIRGDVAVSTASPTQDHIRFLGTLAGKDGATTRLGGVDNEGAAFTVDASVGTIQLDSYITEAVIAEATGSNGAVSLLDGTILNNISFGIDTVVDASGASSVDVSIVNGMTLTNSMLTLQGFNNQARIDFDGAQLIDGTGTIRLAEFPTGPTDNDIIFAGFESFAETLVFGSGITIRGSGVLDAQDTNDKISILGTLVGEGSGLLAINDLDNAGGTVTIDASAGSVGFGSGISNANLQAASANTGAVELLSNGGLRNVTLGIDTRLDAELSGLSNTVRGGLTLDDSTLTVAGSELASATLNFRGAQTLGGAGIVLLSDENAIDGRGVNNTLNFIGVEGGTETFVIGADVELVGEGALNVSNGDLLDIDGNVTARDGTLALEGVEEISGDITAETGAVLSFDRTFGLLNGAGVTIGLSKAGLDADAGLITVAGLLQKGGDFNFDVAGDFDADIGAEFEILRTAEGFTDSFASVTGASIGATRGLALIEDGNSLFARVVDIAQAGQQLTRDDLPADPVLPVLNQNFTDVTLDAALAGGPEVELSGGLWSGVDLSVDAHVQSSRRLDVRDGLTVDGRLGVEASGRVYFQGVQSIDGSGLIELETPSSWLYHVNQLSGSQEIVTFGPDLTLQGQGYITVSSGEDAFRLLGDVRAVGGDLQLNYIDNDGATLSLDSAGGGFVSLRASIENAAIEVSDGADVRAVSSQLSGVSLGGAGVTRIESATVSDLTVLGQAEIEGVTSSFSSPSLSVTNDLTIDGELALSGTNQRTATLRIDGAQTVDGSGTVLLSRNNAISDEVVNNTIRFNGQLFGEREDLIFGPDLTIRGTGNFSVDNGEDRLQMLGTVAAEGGDLLLRYVDNMGEVLTVDPGDGALKFGTLIENTVVTAASGATGSVGFESGVDIRSTTFNADARLEATFGTQVDFEGDVTINGTFELAASPSREATINLRGAQTIDGTGEILMSRANLNPGQAGTNNVTFVGDLNGTEEIGTFGAGLGLRGTGILSASRGEDSIRVLGQVTAEDGDLILRDVDNAGADLIVDATAGQVVLGERVTDTVATGTGTLGLEDGLRMDGLTLNMDALIGGQTQGVWVYSEGTGLTVNATLEIAAGVSRNAYLELEGEQTLGGTGTIRLTDANNPLQDPNNLIIFDGQDNNAVETLTIAEEMEVIGEGYIYAQDQNDTILLEGTILADDGTLRIDDLEGLEGTLGATDDGVLNIQTPLTLTERGTLAVGVSNDGVGLINATGNVFSTAVELMGTLAIDVEDGFTANIGDQFAFMTSNSGFSGDFDGFAGFDLAGNQAFKLIQTSTTQLALEVTTDQDANNLGFNLADDFVFQMV